MAIRTYIPGILVVARYLKKYLAKYGEKLKANMGEGLYAVLVLIVDLVEILSVIINGNSDANGDFLSPLNTLTSSQINEVHAAVAKFDGTIGA